MYAVSNEYKEAIKKPAIRTRVNGTIDEIEFTDENIFAGSFSITNQNSGNDSIQIGTVYIGELNITFRNLTLERYSLNGKKITANFELLLSNKVTWESVPLGVYYISEANYTAAGLQIKAYDVLSKFDKNFSGEVFTGKPYDLIKYACDECGVELGTTKEEFETYANGNELLALWQEGSDIETWRDYLSWVSQACGGYATASRDGKLLIRTYNQTVIDTVDTDERFKGASYSDYETRYTGIYVTNMNDNIMNYYGAEVEDGLTYNLGANPFLQYGTETVKERIRRAVLDGLAVVEYVPFSVELPENPAYDLGDVLSFPNGLGDGDKLFCINKYVWNYHRTIKIEGVGENPILASAQSKADKNISGIISKIDSTKTVVYNFINLDPLLIGSINTEILSIDYFAKDVTSAMFIAEILIDITANDEQRQITGTATYEDETETEIEKTVKFDFTEKAHPILTVTYKSNEVIVSEFTPEQVCRDGKQIITLFFPLPVVAQNSSNNFTVYLKLGNGSGTIAAQNIRATLSGQGLVSETADWNGRIRLSENIALLDISTHNIVINGLTDNVSVTNPQNSSKPITSNIGLLDISTTIQINGLTDTVSAVTE